MKKRLVLLTIILGISLSGCIQKEANTEPTEVVIETETEEPTEEVVVIETETEEPVDIYSDEVIGTLAMYDFFEGKTDEEIKEYIKSDDDLQYYLETKDADIIEKYVNALYKYYGNDKSGSTNASSSNTSNSSSSKGNSSSSNNNVGGQSNTSNSNTGSNSSTPTEQGNTVETPPADSNEANMQGDGTFTFDDASNFGGQFIDPGDSWNIE